MGQPSEAVAGASLTLRLPSPRAALHGLHSQAETVTEAAANWRKTVELYLKRLLDGH